MGPVNFWEDMKHMAPECIAMLSAQSHEFHAKMMELFSRKANLVSRLEFERQKQICMKLQMKIAELEQQISDFKVQMTTSQKL